MHENVQAFVQSAAEAFELENPIYEFGYSPDLSSAEADLLRECFPETGCTGGDVRQGTQIDRLEDLTRLPFPNSAARTVICIGALEHVFEPRRAMEEMIRILAPGGILLVCSPLRRQMTDLADRYWRPTPGAVQRLLGELEATLVGWQGADQFPHTVFGIGCKLPVPGRFLRGANRFLDRFQQRLRQSAERVRWWRKLVRLLSGLGQTEEHRRAIRDFHKARFILHLPVDQHLKHQVMENCLPEESTGTRLDLSQ